MSNTNVTVTVQDPTGQAWADGSISYRIAGTKPVFFNGVPLADVWFTKQTVKLDGSGSAAFALPDNSQMTPFGQMWQLTVNPNAYTTGITVYIAITGATMDISAVINNAIQQPSVVPLTVPFAYDDSNILLQNGVGELYYNTGAEVGLRVYTGLTWRQVDSGGGGGGSPTGPLGAVQFNSGGSFGGTANLLTDGTNLTVLGKITSPSLATLGGVSTKGIIFPTAEVPTLNIGTDTAIIAVEIDASGNTSIEQNLLVAKNALVTGNVGANSLQLNKSGIVIFNTAGVAPVITPSPALRLGFDTTTSYIDSYGQNAATYGDFQFRSYFGDGTGGYVPFELDTTAGDLWFRTQGGAVNAFHVDHGGNAVFGGNVFAAGYQTTGAGLDIQTDSGPIQHFKIWDDGATSFIDAAHGGHLTINQGVGGGLVSIQSDVVMYGTLNINNLRGFNAPTLNDVTGTATLNGPPRRNVDVNVRAITISGWFVTNGAGSNVGNSQILLSSDGVNFTSVWEHENTSAVANSHIGFAYGPIPYTWWYKFTGSGNIASVGKLFELCY